MKKNMTPIKICLVISSIITLGVAILMFFLYSYHELNLSYQKAAIILAIILVMSYVIVYYFFSQYIFKRLHIIYNLIRKQKLEPASFMSSTSFGVDVVQKVEDEVQHWAEDYGKQIKGLESLANYRREFIGNLSHEIKTPIFNLQGFISSLLDGTVEDEELKTKFLERAAKNADRLASIAEDLATIAKIEAHHMVLSIEPFDIVKTVSDVFEELEYKADLRKINLKQKPVNAKILVNADRESIREVMINFVENSIKYGKEKGKTEVIITDETDHVFIRIIDNGIGIKKKHLNHLSDRFYRVEKGRSIQQNGTGLGLSIVKHILEAHHTNYSVSSEYGKGTTFAFSLDKA